MSPPPSSGPQLGFLPSFACSAVAACLAEVATLPLDTAKVRLQMQGGLLKPGEAPKYRCARLRRDGRLKGGRAGRRDSRRSPLSRSRLRRGLLGTVTTVAREEGVGALWKGLEPGAFWLSPPTRRHPRHCPVDSRRPSPPGQACTGSASSAACASGCTSR